MMNMPENSTHNCTNAVNNVQPIRNSSHIAKILSVYNRLQAGDYENGNGSKRRLSRLTQFIHAMLQLTSTIFTNKQNRSKLLAETQDILYVQKYQLHLRSPRQMVCSHLKKTLTLGGLSQRRSDVRETHNLPQGQCQPTLR